MANTTARDWATTIALTTTIILAGGAAPAQAAAAPPTRCDNSTGVSAMAFPVPAHPATPEALTRKYTSPDGLFSFRYPAHWKLSTKRGFPELTSPDGSVTGRVALRSLLGPKDQIFRGPVLQYRGVAQVRLSREICEPATLYAGYLPARNPARDTVVWRVTNDDRSGMITRGRDGSGEIIRAEFVKSGVNRSGHTVSERRAGRIVERSYDSRRGVTIEAILQSLEVRPSF